MNGCGESIFHQESTHLVEEADRESDDAEARTPRAVAADNESREGEEANGDADTTAKTVNNSSFMSIACVIAYAQCFCV